MGLRAKALMYLDGIKAKLAEAERAETSDMQLYPCMQLLSCAEAFQALKIFGEAEAKEFSEFALGTFARRRTLQQEAEITSGRRQRRSKLR